MIELSDGRNVNVLQRVCEKENAPTIVFVHGFPLDHSTWLGQLPLVAEASLLMPDLSGFGKSDLLHDGLSMKSLADDVAELLGVLGIPKAIWCGLSMGGYIGWEFVKNHAAMLDGLICCNTRATPDDELTARARRVAASQVMSGGAEPVAEAMRGKLFSESTLSGKPQIVDSMMKVICQTAPESMAAAQLAMSRREDSSDLLSWIETPTMIVAGAEDTITPAREMQLMAMGISGASYVELAQAGHMSPLERPNAFNNCVTHWISRL